MYIKRIFIKFNSFCFCGKRNFQSIYVLTAALLRTFPGCCQLLVSGWKDYCPPIAAEACGEPFLRRNYLRLYCRHKPLHRNFGESMAALVVYIISIMAAAIISILYSYLFYKKKLATEEGLKIQYNTKKV